MNNKTGTAALAEQTLLRIHDYTIFDTSQKWPRQIGTAFIVLIHITRAATLRT